jgi:predicted RNase H-like nuclease (RuvC/YqgF family)
VLGHQGFACGNPTRQPNPPGWAAAAKKESEAERFKEKIAFLESSLSDIRKIARTQDEELEKLNFTVRGSRSDMERARGIRSIESNADELCRRLAEVGHGCDE